MEMNRPPLGPGVLNSEINPPQEVPCRGSFPCAFGGLATVLTAPVVVAALISRDRRHEGWAAGSRVAGELAANPAPLRVSNKLAQLKSAGHAHSKFMLPCEQMAALACAKQVASITSLGV